MNGPDFAGAAKAFTDFLAGNLIVTIVVLPGLCTGLDEFERGKPLRIDLSHSFSPPMWPTASEDGLAFNASFSKRDRAVQVPWQALVWAGVPNTTSGAAPSQAKVAALAPPDTSKPTMKEGKLIHVDFASGKRSTQ